MSDLIDSLSRNLRGYWCPMLQYGGLTLRDQTRFKNHGTLTNMDTSTDWVMSRVRGRSGRVLDFDGVNDQIPTTSQGLTTSRRSCAIWFKSSVVLANAQYSPLLKWGTAATFPADVGKGFSVEFGNDANFGSTGIGISQYGDAVGVTGFNDGRWHFGYFESVNSVYSIFIDGVFRASKTMTTNATAGTVVIGQHLGSFYNGQIAEVVIWSRSITVAEIQELYRLGPGWYQPQLPRRIPYSEQQAGFRAYWARRQTQLIGGGV